MEPIKNQFTPMLANKVTKELNFPVFAQRKYDGIRCYITKNGAFTRNHKEIMSIEHIKEDLREFFYDHPNIILDGELYNHNLKDDFPKICSLVKKSVNITEEDIEEARKLIKFYNYDFYDTKDTGATFLKRNRKLEFIHEKGFEYYSWVHIRYADASIMLDADDLAAYHVDSLRLGYEGSIVRLNTPYEMKRSKGLMKVKDFEDTEATIIAVIEGKGRLAGATGKFIMEDADGVVFGCPTGKFTHEERREQWANRTHYIGKTATFEFFGRTPKMSYRHPLFKSIRDYE